MTITNATRPQGPRGSRPTSVDLGPGLQRAVGRINAGTSNDAINALASSLEGTLRSRGVRQTAWVKELLFQARGAQQGVSGDATRFAANVKKAQGLGVLGPNGARSLLGAVGAATPSSQRPVEGSMLDAMKPPQRRKLFASVFEPQPLNGAGHQSQLENLFVPAKKTNAPPPQPQVKSTPGEQKGQVSPALERALQATELLSKGLPAGPLKAATEAVNSALALAKTAQEKGRPADYAKAVSELGEKTVTLVAEIVKVAGKNPQLAAAAAKQLGTVAKVFGKAAGPIKAMDAAVRLVTGKTLGGAPVDANGRADALIDLASSVMPPPVQIAVAVSKAALEALYTHVGVPVQRSIEAFGLRELFGGKSPEDLKALIKALPTDEANANATVRKLAQSGLFGNGSFGPGRPSLTDFWNKEWPAAMSSDSEALRGMLQQDPRKPNAVPDMLREVVAERFKAAALRFIDKQVRDARGNW